MVSTMSDHKRFWAGQPGKGLYTAFTILSLSITLSGDLLCSSRTPATLEMDSQASFHKRDHKALFSFVSIIEISTTRSLEPGKG
jgi:hypothetical protein